jgi:hypothetical protein
MDRTCVCWTSSGQNYYGLPGRSED